MAALFLSLTPFHSFVSLGLMAGPFKDIARHLMLIDRRSTSRIDRVAMALKASEKPGVSVMEFPTVNKVDPWRARQLLDSISDFTRDLSPAVIAVGNDRCPEFYAAVRGCPSARRVYIDDGLHSYLPQHDVKPVFVEALSKPIRRLRYGLSVERPSMLGGSRLVQDGYVLLPDWVHAGLREKSVVALRKEWFSDQWVRDISRQVAAATGLDILLGQSIDLLLLLPHPRLLKAYPALQRKIEDLAAAHVAQGKTVLVKAHPSRVQTPIEQQLRIAQGSVLVMPPELPVEVALPMLKNALVVGALTTALLSLAILGDGLVVRFLQPPKTPAAESFHHDQTQEIYRSVGIMPLDDSWPSIDQKK